MIRSLVLTGLLLVLPLAHSAEAQELRVEGSGRPFRAAAALQRGYPAYPVRALEALGGVLVEEPAGARVALFGDTIRLAALSPFVRAGTAVSQLAQPVYREGGTLYAPLQFFAEYLPARAGGRLRWAGGVLREDRAARDGRAETAAPQRKATSSAARVVVVDPGHGGRDPGKVGPNGLREKTVTLAVAQRLAGMLRERGYEVHLTRQTDTLIALADRPRLANQWKNGRPAALFLSLHANAGPRTARGFETFFLSDARTEDERRVAEMENAAAAYEDEPAGEASGALDHILKGLRNDFYIHASNRLAELAQARMAAFHPGPDRGVKQAGFRVLVGAFMPAVLVEMAFVSSPEEAALLGTSAFQQKVAWALTETVDGFFATHEHLWSEEVGR